jgi:putative membrane protein
MTRFLAHWLMVTVALAVAAWILPGVVVTSFPALLVAGLVLGLINATIRPLLVILTLPITLLTLGLFYLVVNGMAFGLAALVVPGFEVRSLGAAILGALVVSLVSWFAGLFERPEPENDRV